VTWAEAVAGFTDPAPGPPVRPNAANVVIYAGLVREYERFERANVNG
jgi:hypothetical protein